jgi:hypothetical protein
MQQRGGLVTAVKLALDVWYELWEDGGCLFDSSQTELELYPRGEGGDEYRESEKRSRDDES